MTAPGFEQAVLSALEATDAEGQGLYWLIDQSAMPRPPWLRRHVSRKACWDVLRGTAVEEFDGASPVLVRCDAQAACSRLGTVLHGQAQYACALHLLVSALDGSDLCAALRERTRLELPEGLPAILRFFDTRALPVLPDVLTPAQYAGLVAPVSAWWYVDRGGSLQPMPAPKADVPSMSLPPWILTQDQEQALVDDGLADAVIDLLITHGHPGMLERLPPQQYALVAPLVASARDYKLDEPPQALAFVAQALEGGEDFHLQQPWADRLRRHAAGQCAFDEVWA